MKKRFLCLLLAAALLSLCACAPSDPALTPVPSPSAPPSETSSPAPSAPSGKENTPSLEADGTYDSKEEVALYLYTYGELPDNYITKDEARDLGWEGGSVEDYAPGMCIGGDRFSNREGLLPREKGRTYTECDIDTLGETTRGSKRLVYSNDGLIYYTDDHYESFELLYDGE